MAIEAVAAVAAKEVAVEAAKEAALQAGREIAQKMATDAGAQGAGNELQTAMMERQTMQDGFRVGEMSEGKGEGREFLKQKETDAAEELRGKLDTEEVRSETENTPVNESPEVQNPAETEVTEADAAQEVAESQETVESTELAEAQEGAEATEVNELAELERVKTEYADDLISRSEVPETLDKNEIVKADFEKVSSDQCKIMRDEFNQKKADLISQWEEKFGMEWPKYSEDVNFKGKTIREAGNNYDAHHIQPLTHGGKNEAANITPLHALEHCDHQGLHAVNSPYSRMETLLKLKEVA